VTFKGISPYLHGEVSPAERLRVSAGVRYDHLSYRFTNHLAAAPIAVPGAFPGLRFYGQSADTSTTFTHVSPKLGATYALTKDTHVFAAFNHGFRAPSEGQLFRPSAAATAAAAQVLARSALGLQPIKVNQFEAGLKGLLFGSVTYDLAAYELVKRDDILTFRDTATNFTQVVNAGKTRHRGVEAGVGAPFARQFRVDAALSYARHTYEQWVTSGGDFSGREIESAPRVIANTRLTWNPIAQARVQLEWVRLGSYWMDPANTTKYPGHDLLNVRANWPFGSSVSAFASINNLTDERYADSASISSSTPVYSPGLPRTLYAGLEAKW
jgi:outer membrane receptor protein involved in Fe transport